MKLFPSLVAAACLASSLYASITSFSSFDNNQKPSSKSKKSFYSLKSRNFPFKEALAILRFTERIYCPEGSLAQKLQKNLIDKLSFWFEGPSSIEWSDTEEMGQLVAIFAARRFVDYEQLTNKWDKSDMMNLIVRMCSKVSTPNVQQHLIINILMGVERFSDISLEARRDFANAAFWVDSRIRPSICSLSDFLLSNISLWGIVKDLLTKFSSRDISVACLKILFGIECEGISANDLDKFFKSAKPQFYDDKLVSMVCSFYEELSFDYSISNIVKVAQTKDAIFGYISLVLSSSPRYQTANWCMQKLEKPAFPFDCSLCQRQLAFEYGFSPKHISAEERDLVLKKFDMESFLSGLNKLDWTNLDLVAMIKWIVERTYQSDPSTYEQTFETLIYSPRIKNDCGSQTTGDGNCIPSSTQLDRFKAYIDANLESHKAYFGGLGFTENVLYLLDRLNEDELIVLGVQKGDLDLQLLIEYVGKDTRKVFRVLRLPEYYQAMIFLLTECDEIAERLAKHLKGKDMSCYLEEIKRTHSEYSIGAQIRASKLI